MFLSILRMDYWNLFSKIFFFFEFWLNFILESALNRQVFFILLADRNMKQETSLLDDEKREQEKINMHGPEIEIFPSPRSSTRLD